MQIPKRRSEQDRLARKQTDHYLTADAIAKLKRELADLKERQRPRVADEVHRTGEMGDRSENAGYQAAKAQLTRINFRILEIEEDLKHAVIIDRGAGASGQVRIGSTVTMRTGDRDLTFEILGSQESNPSRGRISHGSPLGRALLGRSVGDEVTVTVGGKGTTYTITAVQ